MSRSAGLWIAVMASGVLTGASAGAVPCRLCTEPSTSLQQHAATPVTIEVQTSLDFDRLVLTGATGGTVRLNSAGEITTRGAVSGPGGRAMVGSVIVRGEPHRAVRIDLPSIVELWGTAGGHIVVERIGADLPPSPRLDANGRLAFRFGGEVRVTGEVHGDFRGEIPVTVEYL